jgi:hypothetical protein
MQHILYEPAHVAALNAEIAAGAISGAGLQVLYAQLLHAGAGFGARDDHAFPSCRCQCGA